MPALNGPTTALPSVGGGQQLNDGNTEAVIGTQGAISTYTTTSTITAAELATGILSYTGSGHTLTLPTVALWEALLVNGKTNSSFDFSVIATTGTATLAVGTGWTAVGALTTAADNATRFRARKTGSSAWTVYRIAG